MVPGWAASGSAYILYWRASGCLITIVYREILIKLSNLRRAENILALILNRLKDSVNDKFSGYKKLARLLDRLPLAVRKCHNKRPSKF